MDYAILYVYVTPLKVPMWVDGVIFRPWKVPVWVGGRPLKVPVWVGGQDGNQMVLSGVCMLAFM